MSWRIARLTVGTGVQACLRIEYAGLEHVPRSGGALLAYNHVSVLDPFAVALGVYREGRITRILSVADVFERPVRGWVLRRLRMVPVNRGDPGALGAAVETLRGGGLIAMAPEGTVGTGEELQRGHAGAARISLLSGAPVLPVGVWGTQLRWPKSGFLFRPPWRPVVAIEYGPPLHPDGDPASRDDVVALTGRIMHALGERVQTARTRAR